ncbi:hypothetical protein [Variovorax ginsengisoli]|uniref:Uncharacterized protein n=1 Tax=Variovorax ginsengisoli TaxID=363844 RepID=A0ABT8S9X2_9BURK|nr:hypothetical protein [Variovorax ginsengisoli]MDN8616536.1 hypothetical protein [Variovorax ginsengisoli]MDO1535706.1 hypothetical protein [Variovorax ginsengisoli]
MKIEEGDEIDEATLQHANETVIEFTRGLRSGIYEFRKRAERTASQDGAVVCSAASAEATAPKVADVPLTATGASSEVPEYVSHEKRDEEQGWRLLPAIDQQDCM